MRCPTCGTTDTRVLETRAADNGFTARRSRLCANNHQFPTYEVVPAIYKHDPEFVKTTLGLLVLRISTLWSKPGPPPSA